MHALKWEAATEVWWQAELARSLHLWDCVVVNASLPSLSQSVPVPVPAVDGAIPMLMLTSRRHWFGRSAPPRARAVTALSSKKLEMKGERRNAKTVLSD